VDPSESAAGAPRPGVAAGIGPQPPIGEVATPPVDGIPVEVPDPVASDVAAEPAVKKAKSNRRKQGYEWLVLIAASLAVALVVRGFLIQAFYIPSESMKSSLNVGDRVLVNKLSYHMHDVHRGDIVVFKRPPAESGEPAIKDLIKRVVGLPGDSVEGRDGHVFVNDHLLVEPYLRPTVYTSDFPRQVVPPGELWVMGDNRTNSCDSRCFGMIRQSKVVGRAVAKVWPLRHASFL